MRRGVVAKVWAGGGVEVLRWAVLAAAPVPDRPLRLGLAQREVVAAKAGDGRGWARALRGGSS